MKRRQPRDTAESRSVYPILFVGAALIGFFLVAAYAAHGRAVQVFNLAAAGILTRAIVNGLCAAVAVDFAVTRAWWSKGLRFAPGEYLLVVGAAVLLAVASFQIALDADGRADPRAASWLAKGAMTSLALFYAFGASSFVIDDAKWRIFFAANSACAVILIQTLFRGENLYAGGVREWLPLANMFAVAAFLWFDRARDKQYGVYHNWGVGFLIANGAMAMFEKLA